MSENNYFVRKLTAHQQERERVREWERSCDYLVDRELSKRAHLRVRILPGDVDAILWFAFAFFAAIEAATWIL